MVKIFGGELQILMYSLVIVVKVNSTWSCFCSGGKRHSVVEYEVQTRYLVTGARGEGDGRYGGVNGLLSDGVFT